MFAALKSVFDGNGSLPPSEAKNNEQIRQQLRRLGDTGDTPRHVVHYFYARKKRDLTTTRDELIAFLSNQHYTVQRASGDTIVVEGEEPVSHHQFDEKTELLAKTARSHGWAYDGWECEVMVGHVPTAA